MNLSLWIVAGLLAVVFLAGSAKLFVPKEKLATMPGGGWVEDFSPGTLKAHARNAMEQPPAQKPPAQKPPPMRTPVKR